MSDHTCNECHCAIIENGEIIGCPHFPADDVAELSGKQISDGIAQVKADQMAIQAINEANKGENKRIYFDLKSMRKKD